MLRRRQQGHHALFHPDGQGELTAMRYGPYKAFFKTYSAPACGGHVGRVLQHDPPLIFSLSADEREAHPLSDTLPPTLLDTLRQLHRAKLADIESTPRSRADYATSPSAMPCCNPHHVVCRCDG